MARRSSACRPIRAAASFVLLLSSASSASASAAASPSDGCTATIIEAPQYVAFHGCLLRASADELLRALQAHPRLPLLIHSGGGEVDGAMDIARVLARHGTRLIVRGACLSSCANYLVPAAASVDAEHGSAIGFHGDVRTTLRHHPDLHARGTEVRRGMEGIQALEVELGRAITKVEDVHVLQSIRQDTGPLHVTLRGRRLDCQGLALPPVWAPTLGRLQALGLVTRIVYRDAAWAPQVPSDSDSHPLIAADDDTDPAAHCVDATRP